MYDKGHGVRRDVVLAYKWLNLAAARAPRRERDYFLRLRNAVASKMLPAQIHEGQYLALVWAPGLPKRWDCEGAGDAIRHSHPVWTCYLQSLNIVASSGQAPLDEYVV